MSPEFLESAAQELFGENWKSKLSAALGRDESTLRRHGYREIVPGPVQAVVAAWLILRRAFKVLPPSAPDAPFTSILTGKEVLLEDDDASDLVATASKLFGAKWKTPMADALGIERTSLWRLASAQDPSGPILAAIRAWMLIYRFSGLTPPFDYTNLLSSVGGPN